MTSQRRAVYLAFGYFAIFGGFALLAGCNIVGAVSYIAIHPKTPAEYKPAKDDMLVLAENFRNPASVSFAAEQLDRQLAYELVQNKVAPVVNPDRLVELRTSKEQRFRSMKVDAIGKALGARQVLYVDVVDFSVESALGAEMSRGHAELRVRIIDAATGQTRWPQDIAAGYPMKLDTPFLPLKNGVTETTLREQMIRNLANRTAKLFYEHEPDEEMEAPIAPVGD